MPVHDWTKVYAGALHAFHHNWIAWLSGALNEATSSAERRRHRIAILIWQHFGDDVYEPPAGRPLVLASCDAGGPAGATAYVEPIGVGDTKAFAGTPEHLRAQLESDAPQPLPA